MFCTVALEPEYVHGLRPAEQDRGASRGQGGAIMTPLLLPSSLPSSDDQVIRSHASDIEEPASTLAV